MLVSLSALVLFTGCSKNDSPTAQETNTSANEKPKALKVLYATVEAGSEAIIDAAKKIRTADGNQDRGQYVPV